MMKACAVTVATQEKNRGAALEDMEGAVQRAEDSRAAAAFTSPVKAVVLERADTDDDVLTQKMADSLAQARACGRRGVEALRANELEMAVQEFALGMKHFNAAVPADACGEPANASLLLSLAISLTKVLVRDEKLHDAIAFAHEMLDRLAIFDDKGVTQCDPSLYGKSAMLYALHGAACIQLADESPEKKSLLKRAEKSLLDAHALDPENAKIENYVLKAIHASLPRFEPPAREASFELKIQDAVRCIKLPPMPSSDPRAVLLELWKTLSGLDGVITDKRYSYRSKENDVMLIRDRLELKLIFSTLMLADTDADPACIKADSFATNFVRTAKVIAAKALSCSAGAADGARSPDSEKESPVSVYIKTVKVALGWSLAAAERGDIDGMVRVSTMDDLDSFGQEHWCRSNSLYYAVLALHTCKNKKYKDEALQVKVDRLQPAGLGSILKDVSSALLRGGSILKDDVLASLLSLDVARLVDVAVTSSWPHDLRSRALFLLAVHASGCPLPAFSREWVGPSGSLEPQYAVQLVRPAEEDKAAADVLLKLSNAIGGRVKFKPITSEEFLQGLRDLGYESLANFEPMSKAVQKQPLKDSTNTPTKGKKPTKNSKTSPKN